VFCEGSESELGDEGDAERGGTAGRGGEEDWVDGAVSSEVCFSASFSPKYSYFVV